MTRRQRYFIKQKLMGLAVIVLGIVSTVILNGDATACIITVPMGLVLIFTKQKAVLNDDYIFEIEEPEERAR